MKNKMTSMERVVTTLSHKEPDRVPFFLFATMHGAKELELSLKDYFSKAEYVVEGQMRILKKYKHDCVTPFFYAANEMEAWGARVIFAEDGPANAGAPIIENFDEIKNLTPPEINSSPSLQKVLSATKTLKDKLADSVPILGVAISPFSLPVMQLGFEKYIDLIYERPDLLKQLLSINRSFCIKWANAQLEAGATAIAYFDPVASPTITPLNLYKEFGFKTAKETISKINGPTATHLASGICLPVIDLIAQTGTGGIGVSTMEDLGEIKKACKDKLCVIGNLNGIEMRKWSPRETESIVKNAIRKAAPGGGFILSDNHGEIPFQVPDDVLLAISEAVHKWGNYPLDLVNKHD